jgi:acyl-CoA synthetase (AMP-forming)/AMP-acid ligase II
VLYIHSRLWQTSSDPALGGENIFPAEIEERLLQHSSIAEVSVVGLPDDRYGEVISTFLRLSDGTKKPGSVEVQKWVGDTLGRHKVPVYVFGLASRALGTTFQKRGVESIKSIFSERLARGYCRRRIVIAGYKRELDCIHTERLGLL